MSVIIEPKIKTEPIKIKMDAQSPDAAKTIIADWGRNIPVISIGDYVLNSGDLKDFSLQIALNSLPTFTMTVDDSQYLIREALQNDIDKCVIFLGFKDWYIRFNGILNKNTSSAGDKNIFISGTYYNEKLYNGVQFCYRDKPLVDIFKDVCDKTDMGLFTFDNVDLNQPIDYSLLTGTRYIDYFNSMITNYTKNLFSVDCHSFIHVGDIETIRKQPIDKYSLDWSTGEKIEDKPIIFRTKLLTAEKIGDVIPIDWHTITTNFGGIHKETYKSYDLGLGGNGLQSVPTIDTIGIGSNVTNTFFGFKNHKNPFYTDKINKSIAGNVIKITTQNIIFELSPFSVVGLELYLPFRNGDPVRRDVVHSGNKVVIGYSINYARMKNELNKLSQTIELI